MIRLKTKDLKIGDVFLDINTSTGYYSILLAIDLEGSFVWVMVLDTTAASRFEDDEQILTKMLLWSFLDDEESDLKMYRLN